MLKRIVMQVLLTASSYGAAVEEAVCRVRNSDAVVEPVSVLASGATLSSLARSFRIGFVLAAPTLQEAGRALRIFRNS